MWNIFKSLKFTRFFFLQKLKKKLKEAYVNLILIKIKIKYFQLIYFETPLDFRIIYGKDTLSKIFPFKSIYFIPMSGVKI